MTVCAVDREYIAGVKAFCNLLGMLEEACKNAQIKASPGNGDCFQGWSIDNGMFWTGVYFGQFHHELIIFKINRLRARPDETRCKEAHWQKFADGSWGTAIDLREKMDFFELPKEEQIHTLTNFVENAYRTGMRCIAW